MFRSDSFFTVLNKKNKTKQNTLTGLMLIWLASWCRGKKMTMKNTDWWTLLGLRGSTVGENKYENEMRNQHHTRRSMHWSITAGADWRQWHYSDSIDSWKWGITRWMTKTNSRATCETTRRMEAERKPCMTLVPHWHLLDNMTHIQLRSTIMAQTWRPCIDASQSPEFYLEHLLWIYPI